MTERLNISYCANSIAAALHRAGKNGHVTRIDIDGVRCAVMGYLASGTHVLSKYDIEQLIEATLRKVVEKVG